MATGDIISITVSGDGPTADGSVADGSFANVVIEGVTTEGFFANGFDGPNGNDPDTGTPTMTLHVISHGYDDTGTLGATTNRIIYGTIPQHNRFNVNGDHFYNNVTTSGGNLIVRIALSDYIFASDTGPGAGSTITADFTTGFMPGKVLYCNANQNPGTITSGTTSINFKTRFGTVALTTGMVINVPGAVITVGANVSVTTSSTPVTVTVTGSNTTTLAGYTTISSGTQILAPAGTNNAVTGKIVTNNSGAPYPKVVGNWSWVPSRKLAAIDTLRAVCFHFGAQQGRPLRVIKFVVTDQHSHTLTKLVTQMTIDPTKPDALPVQEYIATFDFTDAINGGTNAMTQGDTLTANFIAYPWIGDANSILDTSNTAASNFPIGVAEPTIYAGPKTFICDISGTYSRYVAVVDAISGSDGAQALTQDPLTSTPFATIGAAYNALLAQNFTSYARRNGAGSTIYLKAGYHPWIGIESGSKTAESPVATSWLTITPYPGVTTDQAVLMGAGSRVVLGTDIPPGSSGVVSVQLRSDITFTPLSRTVEFRHPTTGVLLAYGTIPGGVAIPTTFSTSFNLTLTATTTVDTPVGTVGFVRTTNAGMTTGSRTEFRGITWNTISIDQITLSGVSTDQVWFNQTTLNMLNVQAGGIYVLGLMYYTDMTYSAGQGFSPFNIGYVPLVRGCLISQTISSLASGIIPSPMVIGNRKNTPKGVMVAGQWSISGTLQNVGAPVPAGTTTTTMSLRAAPGFPNGAYTLWNGSPVMFIGVDRNTPIIGRCTSANPTIPLTGSVSVNIDFTPFYGAGGIPASVWPNGIPTCDGGIYAVKNAGSTIPAGTNGAAVPMTITIADSTVTAFLISVGTVLYFQVPNSQVRIRGVIASGSGSVGTQDVTVDFSAYGGPGIPFDIPTNNSTTPGSLLRNDNSLNAGCGGSYYNNPAASNVVVAYNWFSHWSLSGVSLALNQSAAPEPYGSAAVQNVFEACGNDGSPVAQFCADGTNASPVDNLIIWHNTLVGARTNGPYNSDGSASKWCRWWSVKNNLFDGLNIKSDSFSGDYFFVTTCVDTSGANSSDGIQNVLVSSAAQYAQPLEAGVILYGINSTTAFPWSGIVQSNAKAPISGGTTVVSLNVTRVCAVPASSSLEHNTLGATFKNSVTNIALTTVGSVITPTILSTAGTQSVSANNMFYYPSKAAPSLILTVSGGPYSVTTGGTAVTCTVTKNILSAAGQVLMTSGESSLRVGNWGERYGCGHEGDYNPQTQQLAAFPHNFIGIRGYQANTSSPDFFKFRHLNALKRSLMFTNTAIANSTGPQTLYLYTSDDIEVLQPGQRVTTNLSYDSSGVGTLDMVYTGAAPISVPKGVANAVAVTFNVLTDGGVKAIGTQLGYPYHSPDIRSSTTMTNPVVGSTVTPSLSTYFNTTLVDGDIIYGYDGNLALQVNTGQGKTLNLTPQTVGCTVLNTGIVSNAQYLMSPAAFIDFGKGNYHPGFHAPELYGSLAQVLPYDLSGTPRAPYPSEQIAGAYNASVTTATAQVL